MANGDKISACFLCLRNVEKAGHGYSNKSSSNDNLLLLKRFLSWSLELPPAVIGDLLCTNIGTGEGQQGQEENLLCGSCEMEMGAACQLYNELAKKLMELEEILENSVKRVSDKLSANLHQQVAKQRNHSFGSSKEGGRRVQRLRDLLALKLGTVTYHKNRYLDERETETAWTFESDHGDHKESEATEGSGVSVNETVEDNEGVGLHVENDDDGGGGSGQCNAGPISTSTAKASGNLGLGVERPFMCLRCSESFMDIDSVQRHHERCKPLVSCGNGNTTPAPTRETVKLEPVGPKNGGTEEDNGKSLFESDEAAEPQCVDEEEDEKDDGRSRSKSDEAADAKSVLLHEEEDEENEPPQQSSVTSNRSRKRKWTGPVKPNKIAKKSKKEFGEKYVSVQVSTRSQVGPSASAAQDDDSATVSNTAHQVQKTGKRGISRTRPLSPPGDKEKRKRGRPKLPESSLQCSVCNKIFKKTEHLQMHILQKHHTENDPVLQCPNCPLKFNAPDGLRSHSIQHLPDEARTWFYCQSCNVKFSSSANAIRHQKTKKSTCDKTLEPIRVKPGEKYEPRIKKQ